MQYRIVRLKQLATILSLSRATLWRRVKSDSDFPKIIRLGSSERSAVGFLENEVNDWLEKCVDKREEKLEKASEK